MQQWRGQGLDGTDHASQQEQASMIRRSISWRNNHAYDERLRRIGNPATGPDAALGWELLITCRFNVLYLIHLLT